MINIKVESKNGKTYVKCGKCGTVLLTNDQEYLLTKIKRNELYAISSCEHYENVSIHKDPESLQNLKEIRKLALLEYEGKYYITFLVPRQS